MCHGRHEGTSVTASQDHVCGLTCREGKGNLYLDGEWYDLRTSNCPRVNKDVYCLELLEVREVDHSAAAHVTTVNQSVKLTVNMRYRARARVSAQGARYR